MKLSINKKFNTVVRTTFNDNITCDTCRLTVDQGFFTPDYKTFFSTIDANGEGKIFFGLGNESDSNDYKIINAFYTLAQEMKKYKIYNFELKLPKQFNNSQILKSLEGILHEEYKFETYKTEKSDFHELEISLRFSDEISSNFDGIEEQFDELQNLIKAVNLTKELVNIPSNDLYPESFSNMISKEFENTDVKVEVYDDQNMKEFGMEAALQVGLGSDKKSKLIVLKYMHLDEKEHLTFVGKGVTYDSGGYAIKPATGMVTMKSDMAGSASLVGLFKALNENKIQKNVVGVIIAVENMISGNAFKNGDIISSMKGSTIEIVNTDAEGRLTLADAVYYAATKLESKAIVDLATLTGACVVAVGDKVTGMLSNNNDIAKIMEDSFEKSSEYVNRFNIFPPHRNQVKSKIADLKNSTVGGAGMITAGVFIEHFVEEKPWVHLDIAGNSYTSLGYDFYRVGGTGNPVKSIYEFTKQY